MIYFYYGENIQERDSAINELTSNFISTHGDMAVDIIETESSDYASIIDSVTTTPFLSTKRMVVVRYLSSDKELSSKIEDLLSRVADSTDLLIIESSIDNRSIYAKTLKAKSDIVRNFESLDSNATVNWVQNYVTSKEGQISYKDANFIVDRLGLNQLQLKNELNKLLLINKNITEGLIDDVTPITPQSSVFAMLDYLMQGNVGKASSLYYEQRAQGVDPQNLLSMIAWQLHILAIITASGKGKSADEIAKRSKLNVFVVRKNMSIANKIHKGVAVKLLDAAILSDLRIKTGKSKPDPEVHALIINIGAILKTT
jgi:DNA polymerase-3 subunit delta